MLRIAICDDNADARLALRSALERLMEERRTEGSFFEFSTGEGLLRWQEKHAGELDLVFLDIEMGELDGMETARRLRSADETLQLVFVTGYTDYVFDGYSVGAAGYLMKPPRPKQLEEVMDRVTAALLGSEEKVFLCRSRETLYRIPRQQIRYFSSDRPRSPASPNCAAMSSTENWTRWKQKSARASCASTSATWSAQAR